MELLVYRRRPAWRRLPTEALIWIARYLRKREDVVSMRAVCRSWYRAIIFTRLFLPLPKLILSQDALFSFFCRHSYFPTCFRQYRQHRSEYRACYNRRTVSLITSCVFLVKSRINPDELPWLITVEEVNPGRLVIRRPFSKVSAYRELPQDFPIIFDTSSFQVTELSRFYSEKEPCKLILANRRTQRYNHYSKVVFIWDINDTTSKIDDIISIVVLYDDGLLAELEVPERCMWKIKIPSGDGINMVTLFDDVVSIRGRIICAIDYEGAVFMKRGHNKKWQKVVQIPSALRKKRLVTSDNGRFVYVVQRCPEDSAEPFELYFAEVNVGIWDYLEGIGEDRILIFTMNGGFFVEANDMPGWEGNCIVFPRGCFPEYGINSNKADMEIFGNRIIPSENNTIGVAVYEFGTGRCGLVESYPGYSQLLWPPPQWFFTQAR